MKEVPILYSTGCPKCSVLINKLNESHMEYEICNDVDKMISLGFDKVPVLCADGFCMDFDEAISWIKTMEA